MFLSLSSTIRMTLIEQSSACVAKQRELPSFKYRPGQRECKDRAFAELAVDANRSAMQLDEAARQRKPQTRSFVLARVLATDLSELLEDCLVIGGGNANAGVLDGDFH